MKLKIQVKKLNSCCLKLTIENNIYYINDEIDISIVNPNLKIKLEIVSVKKTNSRVKYCFSFHKNNSKDFFQFSKKFNSYSAEYILKVHRDAKLVFELFEDTINNSFSLPDIILKLRVARQSNIKIISMRENIISTQNIRNAIIIDSLMLFVRIVLTIIVCVGCCYYSYYYRNEMRTVFQGEMIWLLNLGYVIFSTVYIATILIRNIKYFKNLNSNDDF